MHATNPNIPWEVFVIAHNTDGVYWSGNGWVKALSSARRYTTRGRASAQIERLRFGRSARTVAALWHFGREQWYIPDGAK